MADGPGAADHQRHLHDMLTALHEELRALGPVSAENRALLERLAGDIRAITGTDPGNQTPDRAFKSRLVKAAAAFEVSHPQLSRSMESVVDALANWNL